MRKINYDETWVKDQNSWARAIYIGTCLMTAGCEHFNINCMSGQIQISAFSHSEEEREEIEKTINARMSDGETMETKELTGLNCLTYCTEWERKLENWESVNEE